MTRPIYEPNPQRQGASLEFGQQQLYRRPAPVTPAGGAPIVYRAEQWNNTVTVASSGDLTQVIFDEFTNPDNTIFSDGLSGGDLASVEILVVPCLIVAKLAWDWTTNWTTTGTTSQTASIYDQITVWPQEGVEYPRVGPGAGTGTMDYEMTFMEYYPTIANEQGHGGVAAPTFSFWLAQNTGLNKDAQGRMTIAYWAI